jgi:hypothetical protein
MSRKRICYWWSMKCMVIDIGCMISCQVKVSNFKRILNNLLHLNIKHNCSHNSHKGCHSNRIPQCIEYILQSSHMFCNSLSNWDMNFPKSRTFKDMNYMLSKWCMFYKAKCISDKHLNLSSSVQCISNRNIRCLM